MPCFSGPSIPYPSGIDILLPDLVLDAPGLPGAAFCCTFEGLPIPGFPILIPIGSAFALLGAAGDAILATIDEIIDLLNDLLDLIPTVECPLD